MPSLLRSRLEKLSRLDADEWRILLAASWLLPATALSLRVFGYRRTRSWLACDASRGRSNNGTRNETERVANMVRVAARHGIHSANCLPQALVAWRLLARKGIATDLRIGVQKDANGFSAHAWVEREGEVIIGGADSPGRFQSMH